MKPVPKKKKSGSGVGGLRTAAIPASKFRAPMRMSTQKQENSYGGNS